MVNRGLICVLLLSSACVQDGLDRQAEERVQLDSHFYRCQVQPLVTKSCAFMDCHGNDERPLRIYAEQRFRINPDWIDYEDVITEAELAANLRAMEGFVEGADGPGSLLTEKPLDARFGGRYHRGRDLYGVDDVFLSRDDADYKVLREFAAGAVDTPDCVPMVGGLP